MNAGEPIEEEVMLAPRIAAQAELGEILVSNTVRDLTLGRSFTFRSPRDVQAKGFEEPVRVWSVGWRP